MACDVVVASGSAWSAVEPQWWHCCGLLVECCGCYISWSVLVDSDSCYVVCGNVVVLCSSVVVCQVVG